MNTEILQVKGRNYGCENCEPTPLLRSSQGLWGNRRKSVFISGEQENKGQILRETGEQRQYWGTGNITKQIFDFWGTGEQANLFQGNKGTGTPSPLGGPHYCIKVINKIIFKS